MQGAPAGQALGPCFKTTAQTSGWVMSQICLPSCYQRGSPGGSRPVHPVPRVKEAREYTFDPSAASTTPILQPSQAERAGVTSSGIRRGPGPWGSKPLREDQSLVPLLALTPLEYGMDTGTLVLSQGGGRVEALAAHLELGCKC